MTSLNLTVSCSCTTLIHTFSVPTSALPLSSHLCSCDISRRISGSLLTSYVNITHCSGSKPDLKTLTPYDSSSILRRWFCSTCGTHMYLEYHDDGHFEAATGTLQVGSTDGIVEYSSLMWIEDTKDGGASQFISEIGGRELARYAQEAAKSEQVSLNWQRNPLSSADPASSEAKPIHAHCHCRGVEFWITPPNEASRDAKSPFPDLLIPHHRNNSANPDNIPWWLAGSGNRYLAGTCACTSCRRASGFDITFWAFVPTSNIFLDDQLAKPFRPTSNGRGYSGTMKTYQSSPGVTRTFCAVCGANVFWNGDKEHFGREGLVDVAVGLLDAESGARAEEVLAWWPGRVSFEEDALNKALVKGLEAGLKEWAERNEGRNCVARFDENVLKASEGVQ